MNSLFAILFSQYQNTPTYLVTLELTAVVFGLLSVIFAKKQNILVFPCGIISTIIFVYILAVHSLWGNMLINAYYTIMSIYGWVLWTRKDAKNEPIIQVTHATKKEWLLAGIV
ncbi:MAG: nicotinamide riboside transporter PnuC, partial [Neisseriaceae bacterium]|nr:nicotinamide riboside transporter PnuC [Neisseriaceae bacterium]